MSAIFNSERLFMVETIDANSDISTGICHLSDLQTTITELGGAYATKVSHYWNHKWTRISKRDIISMLQANGYNHSFLS